MTKITEAYQFPHRRHPLVIFPHRRHPLVICDFSPPRGSSPAALDDARTLHADFISVNYNPGRVPRADSAVAAHLIRQRTCRDVIFTLATRDMNPLALQSHLLGAAALGLENVLIVAGDPFPNSQPRQPAGVRAMSPTELIRIAQNMNHGLDRRNRPLEGATNFCIGAAIDLSDDIKSAACLAHNKIQAGAQFFLTQPIFDPHQIHAFHSAYQSATGEPLTAPVFYGVQILTPNGPTFSPVPSALQKQLEAGRSGVDIALQVWSELRQAGADALYLIPPVGPRGARDYQAAARFLQRLRP